ncbi:unnamed protein product [Clavelina lepadiformis]|uniref:Alkylglycerol monooxygenase n=3 Tax=Clavelina lepadiformis TaxID=159417 RepID=A0ABP0G5S1_CLALP
MNVSQITLVPHLEAYKPGFFESLRSLFYFLLPSESSFRDVSHVPDYTSAAVPAFFSLIFLELILCLLRGRRTLRVNDTITSLNAGVASRLIRLVSKRSIELVLYINVYDRFRLFDLPWDSNYTWILSFIGMDFAYYWFHRLAHEVNIFWISHQTHHSSEDYNLATALRQSSLQGFVSMFIYLPNALFIPPSVHLVHSQVNILFQFWIHTELIDNLGPLEYILNTPSHHRVHHGRNPYCIDKNYAGALIIWDRMFGTFAAERKEEDLAYGLVHPLNSFDPIYVQLGSLQSLCVRFWNTEGFWNKISVLVKGPGWSPGKPRCGDFNDLPQVEKPIIKHDPDVSSWISAYALVHYVGLVPLYDKLMLLRHTLSAPSQALDVTIQMSTAMCMGFLFDKKPYAYFSELVRCLLIATFFVTQQTDLEESHELPGIVVQGLQLLYLLSAFIWFLVLVMGDRDKGKLD